MPGGTRTAREPNQGVDLFPAKYLDVREAVPHSYCVKWEKRSYFARAAWRAAVAEDSELCVKAPDAVDFYLRNVKNARASTFSRSTWGINQCAPRMPCECVCLKKIEAKLKKEIRLTKRRLGLASSGRAANDEAGNMIWLKTGICGKALKRQAYRIGADRISEVNHFLAWRKGPNQKKKKRRRFAVRREQVCFELLYAWWYMAIPYMQHLLSVVALTLDVPRCSSF